MVRLNNVLSTASWCDESRRAIALTQMVQLNGNTRSLPILSSDLSKLSSWSNGGNSWLCDNSRADGRRTGSCCRREVMTGGVQLGPTMNPWSEDILCC